MKFIFPQNYQFKNKLFGIIDYPTILINIIWYILILLLINIFSLSLTVKIFVFITFCFPLFLFSLIGFNGENFVYVLFYIFKYMVKCKLLFYDKKYNFKCYY